MYVIIAHGVDGLFGGKLDPFAELVVGDGSVWKHVTSVKNDLGNKVQWALDVSKVVSVQDIQRGKLMLFAKDSNAKTADKVIGSAVVGMGTIFSNLDEWVDVEGQLLATDNYKSYGQFAMRIRYRVSPLPSDNEQLHEIEQLVEPLSETRSPAVQVVTDAVYLNRPPSPEVVRYVHDLLQASVCSVEAELQESLVVDEPIVICDDTDLESADIVEPFVIGRDDAVHDKEADSAVGIAPYEPENIAVDPSGGNFCDKSMSPPPDDTQALCLSLAEPPNPSSAPPTPIRVIEAKPSLDGFLEISNLNLTNLKNTGIFLAINAFLR